MDWKSILKQEFDRDTNFRIRDMCCFSAKIDMGQHPIMQGNYVPDEIYDYLDGLPCKEFYEVLEELNRISIQQLDASFKQNENIELPVGTLDGLIKMAKEVLVKWDDCKRKEFQRDNV